MAHPQACHGLNTGTKNPSLTLKQESTPRLTRPSSSQRPSLCLHLMPPLHWRLTSPTKLSFITATS
eukprot:632660-Prorocentrum_lima.AAC.1